MVGTDSVVLTFKDIDETYAPAIEIVDGGSFKKEVSTGVYTIDNTIKGKIGERIRFIKTE